MLAQLLSTGWLLAAEAAENGENADGVASPFGPSFIPFMVIILILLWMMVLRPQKAKERDHKAMLENLKKNDRVVTIGGIHGTVTNVQKDAERVTIRVDETTGATLRVGLSAIGKVLAADADETDKTAAKK